MFIIKWPSGDQPNEEEGSSPNNHLLSEAVIKDGVGLKALLEVIGRIGGGGSLDRQEGGDQEKHSWGRFFLFDWLRKGGEVFSGLCSKYDEVVLVFFFIYVYLCSWK